MDQVKSHKLTPGASAEAGVLKLVKIPPGDMELIVVKDLCGGEDGAGRYPTTFAELKAKSFPVSAFPAAPRVA